MFIVVITQYDSEDNRKYNNYVGPFDTAERAAAWRDECSMIEHDPNYVSNRIVCLISP